MSDIIKDVRWFKSVGFFEVKSSINYMEHCKRFDLHIPYLISLRAKKVYSKEKFEKLTSNYKPEFLYDNYETGIFISKDFISFFKYHPEMVCGGKEGKKWIKSWSSLIKGDPKVVNTGEVREYVTNRNIRLRNGEVRLVEFTMRVTEKSYTYRGLFKSKKSFIELKCDKYLYYSGKGDNSWDQDDERWDVNYFMHSVLPDDETPYSWLTDLLEKNKDKFIYIKDQETVNE